MMNWKAFGRKRRSKIWEYAWWTEEIHEKTVRIGPVPTEN
jgi:hypothetical protein